jgi:hypothetical protein
MTTIDSTLARIAKEHMQIETLETRKHDALDFHTVAVWEAKSALQAAYDAGRAEALGDTDAKAALIDALRENLSPEAVATIAYRLTPTPKSGHRELDAEVTWFATLLAETLGGWSQQERIVKELGF